MTHDEFLRGVDELLGLPAGTLQGRERLEDLGNWDSTALITVVAMIDSIRDVRVSPREIVGCSTVADLLRIARLDSSS